MIPSDQLAVRLAKVLQGYSRRISGFVRRFRSAGVSAFRSAPRFGSARAAYVAAVVLSVGLVSLGWAAPVVAQWWPFEQRPSPPPRQAPPVDRGQPYGRGNPICLELEQRLAQESVRGSQSQTVVPALQNELRKVQAEARRSDRELERRNCYEYFLFTKSLRRTRRCVDLARKRDRARARASELDSQLQQISSQAGRNYTDDIIRELARNNCGSHYIQEARRRDRFGFWDQGEDDGFSGGLGRFRSQGIATYRTICVRLCDGYYFPVSFSTLPNHFERDADVCQQKCAAPAELYYHLNPGAGVDQAMSARTNALYTQLKTAFRYRKEYVQGCSCKIAEFVPEPGTGPQQGAISGDTEWAGGEDGGRSSATVQAAPGDGELPWSTGGQ